MKNKKKIALTILMTVIAFITILLPTVVKATIPSPVPPTDRNLNTLAGKILGYAQWIGILVAVVMLVFYGVKYFTSAPDKQGDLKKAMWGYLIGAACIFGASLILGFVSTTLLDAADSLGL